MMVIMKIDPLASNDPSSGDDGSLLVSFTFGSLSKVRLVFWWLCVSLFRSNFRR
jgi:hypothetical protein